MHAITTARANADPPVPSCKPIVMARADTPAECDDGIPPEPSILLESHLFSLCLFIKRSYIHRRNKESRKQAMEKRQNSMIQGPVYQLYYLEQVHQYFLRNPRNNVKMSC